MIESRLPFLKEKEIAAIKCLIISPDAVMKDTWEVETVVNWNETVWMKFKRLIISKDVTSKQTSKLKLN